MEHLSGGGGAAHGEAKGKKEASVEQQTARPEQGQHALLQGVAGASVLTHGRLVLRMGVKEGLGGEGKLASGRRWS